MHSKDLRGKNGKSETPTRATIKVNLVNRRNEPKHDNKENHHPNMDRKQKDARMGKLSPAKKILFVRSRTSNCKVPPVTNNHHNTRKSVTGFPLQSTELSPIRPAAESTPVETDQDTSNRGFYSKTLQPDSYGLRLVPSSSQQYYPTEASSMCKVKDFKKSRLSLEGISEQQNFLPKNSLSGKRNTVGEHQFTPENKDIGMVTRDKSNFVGRSECHAYSNLAAEPSKKYLSIVGDQKMKCFSHPEKQAKYRKLNNQAGNFNLGSYFSETGNQYQYCCSKCAVQFVTQGSQVEEIVPFLGEIPNISCPPNISPISSYDDKRLFSAKDHLAVDMKMRTQRINDLLGKIYALEPKTQAAWIGLQKSEGLIKQRYREEEVKLASYFQDLHRLVASLEAEAYEELQIRRSTSLNDHYSYRRQFEQYLEDLSFMNSDICPNIDAIVDSTQLLDEQFESIIAEHEEKISKIASSISAEGPIHVDYVQIPVLEALREKWAGQMKQSWKRCPLRTHVVVSQINSSGLTSNEDYLRMSFGRGLDQSPRFCGAV